RMSRRWMKASLVFRWRLLQNRRRRPGESGSRQGESHAALVLAVGCARCCCGDFGWFGFYGLCLRWRGMSRVMADRVHVVWPQTQVFDPENEDTCVPAAPGHYNATQLFGFSAPGLSFQIQVAYRPAK